MLDRGQAVLARLSRFAATHPGLATQLRLFGLLLLLIPLFAGLQRLVSETAPRIEVQFISEDRPILAPVERTVERIIYVPVPADETPQPVTPGPAGLAGAAPASPSSGTPTP